MTAVVRLTRRLGEGRGTLAKYESFSSGQSVHEAALKAVCLRVGQRPHPALSCCQCIPGQSLWINHTRATLDDEFSNFISTSRGA